MPRLLAHVDAIARQKSRTVLFVRFPQCCKWAEDHVDYEGYAPRNQIIQWLDENAVGWEPCGDVASEHAIVGYEGSLYIDVPFDRDQAQYRKIEAFLENPDGTSRIDGVMFCYLTLEAAQKNRHHDEPGFWENWAEKF